MDRGAWGARVHGVARSWTRLCDQHPRMSWQAVVHGVAESDTTQQLNEWNELREHWGTCVFLNHGLHRLLSLVLCDDLEGWDGGVGGRLKWEGIYVYI